MYSSISVSWVRRFAGSPSSLISRHLEEWRCPVSCVTSTSSRGRATACLRFCGRCAPVRPLPHLLHLLVDLDIARPRRVAGHVRPLPIPSTTQRRPPSDAEQGGWAWRKPDARAFQEQEGVAMPADTTRLYAKVAQAPKAARARLRHRLRRGARQRRKRLAESACLAPRRR